MSDTRLKSYDGQKHLYQNNSVSELVSTYTIGSKENDIHRLGLYKWENERGLFQTSGD